MRLALLAVLALLAAGCGAEEGDPPAADGRGEPRLVTFEEAEAVDDGTVVELAAGLYGDDEPMRICRDLAESYPPQCGRSIRVEGVSWDQLQGVQRASGVTWTEGAVGLVGEMRGGVLHVTELREPRPARPSPGDERPVTGGDEPVSSDD